MSGIAKIAVVILVLVVAVALAILAPVAAELCWPVLVVVALGYTIFKLVEASR